MCVCVSIVVRTFRSCKDILAGPHNFKERFQGYDYVLGLGLQLGFD